jgi:hypothetical protein
MVQARAAAAGFDGPHFGGHSLKRGALTTGMERGAHPADLKRLGRHKSFDVLGEYLEFGDLFDRHALKSVLEAFLAADIPQRFPSFIKELAKRAG